MKISIIVENYGEMTFALDEKQAPITVANFISLIEKKFFDGLIFHRIIAGFMIQGGAFTSTYTHRECPSIKGEFKSNGVENNILHKRGVISMARTSDKNSASSQFFIMHQDHPHLDGEYAGFGMMLSGFEVLDKIANVPTGKWDNPNTPVVITTIKKIDD